MVLMTSSSADAGGGRGAVYDIANCAARACLDDANHVLYTQRGECQKMTP